MIESTPAPRRFELRRDEDISGVSGTGVVAQGIAWDDDVAALHWVGRWRSTAVYPSMADLVAVHGHGGATRVVWLDS